MICTCRPPCRGSRWRRSASRAGRCIRWRRAGCPCRSRPRTRRPWPWCTRRRVRRWRRGGSGPVQSQACGAWCLPARRSRRRGSCYSFRGDPCTSRFGTGCTRPNPQSTYRPSPPWSRTAGIRRCLSLAHICPPHRRCNRRPLLRMTCRSDTPGKRRLPRSMLCRLCKPCSSRSRWSRRRCRWCS